MAPLLNRIASRMWLLAWLMTLITAAVGILVYRIAAYYQLHDWVALGRSDLPLLGLVVVISTMTSGTLAMVLARRISRPITEVARAAARVSAGERMVRVEKAGTTGETGELVDSFNRMASDIEAYEKARTVLTAGIAHELRTPLTILKGRLHGLEDGVIDPVTGEATRLLRQVEHILHIVEDLGTLAHADVGELTLDLRVVDLADVLRALVADVRGVVDVRGVSFAENYVPAKVLGDPARLTQIFTNIVANAIKHAPNDRQVQVTMEVTNGAVVTSIIDEGPGFAPGDEQRLFTPFWRAGANKHAGRPGIGMGLALAAKLTEAHGGRITAKNRDDRSGACFSVWLPLAPPRAGAGAV